MRERSGSRPPVDDNAVILEFVPVGRAVRVSAMDPRTLTEVVVQGPALAGEEGLKRAALDKLAWVLRRRAAGGLSQGAPRR